MARRYKQHYNRSSFRPPNSPVICSTAEGNSGFEIVGFQIVDVVYCDREGATGIQSELKTLNIPVINVVKDLSNSKRKDSSQTNDYNEVHQHSLEIHSLENVIDNGIDLNRLLKKRQKPNRHQRNARRQKLEETQDID